MGNLKANVLARFSILVGCLAAAGTASALFVNGDFETGTFQAWTITPTANGTTGYQNVEQFDIDGPGPLAASFAAGFNVGQVVFAPGVPAGIELTQMLSLTVGIPYTFDFDWAATTMVPNLDGGIFDLIVNGTSFGTGRAGFVDPAVPRFGHVTAAFTPTATAMHSVGARITRPFTVPGGNLFQHVDNFVARAIPEPATLTALAVGIVLLIGRRKP